jgi:hypothetical protein
MKSSINPNFLILCHNKLNGHHEIKMVICQLLDLASIHIDMIFLFSKG